MVIVKIDPSNPPNISPSNIFEAALIPIKLIVSGNYRFLSRSMRITLLGKRKYEFVTGECSRAIYKDELNEQ